MRSFIAVLSLVVSASICADAFVITSSPLLKVSTNNALSFRVSPIRMSEPTETPESTASSDSEDYESPMDAKMREQAEKAKRADELRAQETFMVRSTGKFNCQNCEYSFEEAKGDVGTIGGLVKPGTPFAELPSNWRCPTCRASKDNFQEVVEEIPGFEVNQGYGFGGNSLTSGQKSGLVFGGLGAFFLLFLSGYAMS